MSDRKSKASLPLDQPLFHLEFTSFYHPTSEHMPLPPNITHLLLGPFCLLLDERTIRWVLYVYEDISYALRKSDVNLEMDNIPQTNVRIDLIMPKVVVPLCDEWLDDRRLPRRLILSMSTVQASNCVALCNLDSSNSFHSLSSNMIDFIDGTRLPFDILSFRNFVIQLNQSAVLDLEQDCRRFWVNTSPIWVDTDSGEGTRALPVLGDVAFHIAIEITASQVNAAVQPLSTIRLAVDHFQFLQLSRFLTTISDFINQIDADRNFFSQQHSNGIIIPVVIMCLIDQVEVNFILARGSLISPYALHRGMTRSPSPVNQGWP
ncbi:hypothetical protein AB6A40_000833 [Gnathostoma spinigerum]|uniref:Uncharacterized protein n=1 Tax=Gnathostoma spinigerum TaxID=75299 RepID=A0ABD6E7H3_9BILA